MCTQTQDKGTKTIGLDDEAYERLKAQKREDESFSGTVKRITNVSDPTMEELLADLGRLRILSFTAEHVYMAGKIEDDLHADPDVQQDRMDSLMGDLVIAGVVRAIDAPVVTHTVEDFELFDGVSVERY